MATAEAQESAYEVEDGVILDGDTKIEVINDTPAEDQNRTPLREAPAEVTDEELTKYSDQKLKDRLAHLGTVTDWPFSNLKVLGSGIGQPVTTARPLLLDSMG